METSSKQVEWDNTYMQIAQLIAQHSYSQRNKVGAILVKNSRIISIGYNGTPVGFDNQCERWVEDPPKQYQTSWDKGGHWETLPEVLHAESNAISKCARSPEISEGSTLYVTLSPCTECAKLIIQSGIAEVVFKDYYRNIDGLNLLARAGINCRQIQ